MITGYNIGTKDLIWKFLNRLLSSSEVEVDSRSEEQVMREVVRHCEAESEWCSSGYDCE